MYVLPCNFKDFQKEVIRKLPCIARSRDNSAVFDKTTFATQPFSFETKKTMIEKKQY